MDLVIFYFFSDLPSTELLKTLTGTTDSVLDKICTLTGGKYLELGLELGFEEAEIEIIETDHRGCQAITREILKSWIEKRGFNSTWKELGDALYEIRAGTSFIENYLLHTV